MLGWADGLAKANEVRWRRTTAWSRSIGDGALTGGMSWEALNNIAAAKDRPLVIVVNDNERSYAPTIGGLAEPSGHPADHAPATSACSPVVKEVLDRTPVVGTPFFDDAARHKKGLKDFVAPQGMFEDLGLKYVGPIDGHDIEALESALRRAKRLRRSGHRPLHHREGPRLPAAR